MSKTVLFYTIYIGWGQSNKGYFSIGNSGSVWSELIENTALIRASGAGVSPFHVHSADRFERDIMWLVRADIGGLVIVITV